MTMTLTTTLPPPHPQLIIIHSLAKSRDTSWGGGAGQYVTSRDTLEDTSHKIRLNLSSLILVTSPLNTRGPGGRKRGREGHTHTRDEACNNPGKTNHDAKGFSWGPLRKKNAHLRERQTVCSNRMCWNCQRIQMMNGYCQSLKNTSCF